jgi:predicted transcriptional regulator
MKKGMDSRDALLRVKNARMLVSLKIETKRWYAATLARETGASYVYTARMLEVFRREGLVELRKEGKTRRVQLTENGLRVANALEEALSRLPPQEKKSNGP